MSRIKHVNEVRNAVFLEQSRQLISEYRDEEAIARVAQENSRNARVFAALLGRADEVAAKQQEPLTRRSPLMGKEIKQSHELYEETTSRPIIISIF
jgi:hypothetical protein